MGYPHPIYDEVKDGKPPNVGDTVKVSIRGTYVKYDVLTVGPEEDGKRVIVVSRKGVGSARFTWHNEFSCGWDNINRKYILIKRKS